VFGIYLGQEYQGIPSIKLTYQETIKLLKNKSENDKEKEKHDSDSVRSENSDKENESKVKSLASLLRNFLNKTQKDQKDQ
jgi:hypothetical protein